MIKLALALTAVVVCAQERARDLGVRFTGDPGKLNAITDVAGVEVGHTTLIEGDKVRTGVTIVFPRGKDNLDPTFGGWFSLNGNGEMTGTAWLEESGMLDSPVLITNTHSVGTVRDSYIQWLARNSRKPGTNSFGDFFWALPVVAETFDGYLNDINGFHVKPEHVEQAIASAKGGKVAEGNVGGGTGMVCYGFKGGIGTASRRAGEYTVGVLVQCNCGARKQLQISGVPVGELIQDGLPARAGSPWLREDLGSIIITIATDAPLVSNQLKRLARRATMGLARTGSTSGNGSGDLFIAFSTANPSGPGGNALRTISMLPNERMNPIFDATVQAVEEAIVNAMVGAETMTGYAGHRVVALPHDQLRKLMEKH